jgi:hypothetical protein
MRDETAYIQQYQRAMRADFPKLTLGTGMTSGSVLS